MKLKSLIIRWFWACVDFITRPGKDVYYALKAILSVRSGFESLQSRSINEWVPAYGDPYYVCARFKNGRHIPLPLIVGKKSEFPLQNAVLEILRKRGMLQQAENACIKFMEQSPYVNSSFVETQHLYRLLSEKLSREPIPAKRKERWC